MKRGLLRWAGPFVALAACAAISPRARADEIRLKDGSKINGTIVGFEDGAFKVETAYGFALVRKASIAEIVPAEAAPGTGKPAARDAEKTPAATQGAPAAKQSAKSAAKPAAADAGASPAYAKPSPPAAAPAASAAAPAASPEPPKPVPVQETVGYNLYSNQTYGFTMFKPPSWDLLREARSTMPQAITALGTSDGSTMLVIGRDTDGGPLDARATATARQLHDIYENYRPLSSRQITLAGLPAAEQRFRGKAEGHDWSVTVVTLERGAEVFTILGMTYADSDLIQLQENVIAKSIGSLQFTRP